MCVGGEQELIDVSRLGRAESVMELTMSEPHREAEPGRLLTVDPHNSNTAYVATASGILGIDLRTSLQTFQVRVWWCVCVCGSACAVV